MINSVVLVGRTVKEPEVRQIPSGTSVANFTLAINKQLTKDKKQEIEAAGGKTADFINVVAWGKTADVCGQYLGKGKLVAIQGRIQTRSWEAQDGSRRYATEVVAEQVRFIEWKDSNTGVQENDEEEEIVPF